LSNQGLAWHFRGIVPSGAGRCASLRELFAEAEADGITPAEAADRFIERRLAEGAA
jgi:hypothetical protein